MIKTRIIILNTCSILLMFSVFVLTVSGCSVSSKKTNDTFENYMNIDDLNNSIKIKYLDFVTGPNPDDLELAIYNNSNYRINFPVDWGIKIFMNQENSSDWLELANGMNYLPTYTGENPVLTPKGSELAQSSFGISPDIPNDEKSVKIRVFVLGRIGSDNSLSNSPVAAYTDIILDP